MPAVCTETLESLLASADPQKVREGLELAEQEISNVKASAARRCAEVVATLFYIDPLDRPDLVPMIDEAVDLLGRLGDSVIPLLLDMVGGGDVKAQLACAHALGRIGAKALDPLIAEYLISTDPARRALILYALGKVQSHEVVRAVPLALEAAASKDLELRDTATRALGSFAESIPREAMNERLRTAILHILHLRIGDEKPAVRAKAVRSLGKFARCGHLHAHEREELKQVCRALLGEDEKREWDRAYIVRKEAGEALRYCT